LATLISLQTQLPALIADNLLSIHFGFWLLFIILSYSWPEGIIFVKQRLCYQDADFISGEFADK